MRGAPHVRFSATMRKMSSRNSLLTRLLPARYSMPREPGPIEIEAGSMPTDDSLGLNEDQRFLPSRPDPSQQDPEGIDQHWRIEAAGDVGRELTAVAATPGSLKEGGGESEGIVKVKRQRSLNNRAIHRLYQTSHNRNLGGYVIEKSGRMEFWRGTTPLEADRSRVALALQSATASLQSRSWNSISEVGALAQGATSPHGEIRASHVNA